MSSTFAPPRRTLTGHVVHDFNALQSSQAGHNVHNFTALQSSQVNIGDHYYSGATIVNQKPDSLHNWISRIEYWKHHKIVFDDLHPGSGEWLLNKNEFESWESSTQTSVLWLHGIPGSGKSKLVSKVIDYLKPKYKSNGTFAYFYCTRNPAEDERSRPKEVIRSILRQVGFTGTDPKVLKPALASLRTAKEEEAKEHGSEVVEPLNPKECVDTLIKILQGSTTVIVIDSIDELKSEERHEFYKTLSRILNDVDQGVVRVFLSSRDDQDIVHQLSKHANVYISAADNQYDVEEFVKKEVGEAISSGRLLGGRKAISDSLREQIISTLTGGAQGMFRWVSLQIQTLCGPDVQTMKDLKNLLGKLPDTLEASYDTIYHQMMRGKESGRIAGNTIRWLLCSKRQLQSSELIAAAVLTNRDETDTTDEDPEEYEEDDILQFCSNLVVLDQSLGVFRLAHLSVREYFEKKEGYEQSSIQNMAFGTCLDILASKSTSDSALLAGFGSYAIFFWPFHCSDFGPKGPAGAHRDNLLEFLLRGCVGSQFFESFEKWASGVRNLLLAQDDYYSKQLQKEGSRKLLASTIGPYHPVFLASTFGFIWILEVLFEDAGFDPGLKNEQEDSGISLGATFGHLSVVEAFLDRGIDVDFKGESLRTPLNRAVVYKHTELAKFLIAKGADVTFRAASTPGVKAYSPLHEAAWVGHCQIIPLLLKKGADINALSRDASTPLMLAAHNAFIDVVKILLQGGADTTLRDKYGRTAIQLGLFDYSGFIPLRNGRYNSSLTLRTDRVELMKFFLDEGFDVNIVEDGNNTFDCALKQALRHTLEVLVKKEAQPHLRVWSTESPEVTRWRDESWFPQLLEIISKHNFSVSTFLNSGIPFTVRGSREQYIEVIEDTPQVPYVSLQVPDDTVLVTKVTFTTDSHDQGWSGTAAWDRGTYNGSYTYFEAEASTSTCENTPRKRFQSNLHATFAWKTHVVCWDINDVAADPDVKDWVAALKSGDVVKVFPRAIFPGWKNYIQRVVIEIEGLRKPLPDIETLALDSPAVQEEGTSSRVTDDVEEEKRDEVRDEGSGRI